MVKLASDPRLQTLARELGITARGDVLRRLRTFAVGKVEEWSRSVPVTSSSDLLRLAGSFLSVRLVFIRDDTDLDALAKELEHVSPLIRQQLSVEFEERDTLGCLMSHSVQHPGDTCFVALIDARGPRAVKAYFTAWHEISHLLVHPPQLAFEGFRRVTEGLDRKDPLEVLVDQIAGELAFYEPLVGPALKEIIGESEDLTLARIDTWRAAIAPEASFLATATAAVRMLDRPAAFVAAKPKLKKNEARAVASAQLHLSSDLGPPAVTAKLRAAVVIANDAAKAAGFRVFPQMRIPASSIMSQAFNGAALSSLRASEDQSDFEASGRHLPPLALGVEAQFFRPVVYALLLPRL